MKKTLFVYSGEGTRGSESGYKLLQHSKYWDEIKEILQRKLALDLETIWNSDGDLLTIE